MPRALTLSHPQIDWAKVRLEARDRYLKGATFDAIATWIGLTTGYRPTRRTVSNWASTDGWKQGTPAPVVTSQPMQIVHAVVRCGWCDFAQPGRRCVACGTVAARRTA